MLVSIDPGLKSTAYVTWEGNRIKDHGVIHTDAKFPLVDRCRRIESYLLDLQRVTSVAIEYPLFMSSTSGRRTAARGDLTKLTFCVGWIAATMSRRCQNVQLVSVNTWKGNLPKKVTAMAVQRVFGTRVDGWSHDLLDAAGIGLFTLYGKDWMNRARRIGA